MHPFHQHIRRNQCTAPVPLRQHGAVVPDPGNTGGDVYPLRDPPDQSEFTQFLQFHGTTNIIIRIFVSMHSGARKICFIVNPVSGGKDKSAIVARIARELDPAVGREFRFTEHPGHATALARAADADTVVAVGGDGTVREVALGLLGTGKALGLLPCGSGDGLALHLGISRNPSRAIAVLSRGCTTRMDHGLMDGEPFFCTAGVGLDAIVAEKFAQSPRRGLLTYIGKAWQTWQDWRGEPFHLEIDGKPVDTPAVIITAGNGSEWGNRARITPRASVRDGLLDLTVVLPFKTVEIPVLATQLMVGKAWDSRRVRGFRGREILLRRAAAGPAHSDGDPCRKGAEIRFGIVPSALDVVVPENMTDII